MTPAMYWVCLLVAMTVGAGAQTMTKWNVVDFPDPRYEPQRCGRHSEVTESWICDPNNIISSDDASSIDALLKTTSQTTLCSCRACQTDGTGYVIMVALLPQMHRIINQSNTLDAILQDARVYAYYLSLYWDFTPCDQQVIILYDQNNDVVYTLTQADARSRLSDDLVGEITLTNSGLFIPNEKASIARGLKNIIQSYQDVFRGQYTASRTGRSADRPIV